MHLPASPGLHSSYGYACGLGVMRGHLKDFSASNYFSLSYSYEILTLLSIVLILFCNLQCSIVIIYGVRDGVFCCAGKLRNIIGPEFTLADYNLPVLLADIYISLEAS